MKIDKSILILLTIVIFSFAQNRGDIEVNVNGINASQNGNVIISMYKNDKTWLKIPESFLTQTEKLNDRSKLIISFKNVPCDTNYAISVVHDKNRNGKFDMKWLPFPRPAEGACVSNNHVRKGAPKYDEARFEHNQPITMINVDMVY